MTESSVNVSGARSARATAAELIDRLGRFDGPPEQFLMNLLAVQCHIAAAHGGVILRAGAQGNVEILAVFPPLAPGATAPVWVAQSVESAAEALNASRTVIKPLHDTGDLYGQRPRRHLVMLPLLRGDGGGARGYASFLLEAREAAALDAGRERLELTISLLSLYEMRLSLQRRHADLVRLRTAMETLAAVNEHDRFAASAMACCNELAARWRCQRASVGFLRGRYVHLAAMSHTEKFTRKMQIVQDLEAAMEECLDQDVEVIHPCQPSTTYVARAAGELANRHGPSAVASLPIRRRGEPVGVVTLERPLDQPFSDEEIESLRLTCDLCTARLHGLYEHDRWFGARLAGGGRKALAWALGPKHTWAKAAAILAVVVLSVMFFGKGDYDAEAPFALQAVYRHVVPAPFDGFLKSVHVSPGGAVEAGKTLLAALDTSELRLQLAAARAEQAGYLKQASAAMKEDKTAEAQIAAAQADKAAAQGRLLEYRIAQAQITSPATGVVVAGDLEKQIGAPFKTGDVMFEVAPLESLRAELSVPEDCIADVRPDCTGELAATSYPSRRIPFIIERIDPVAEVAANQNVFKVRVRLLEREPWMRPGMEGQAKIHIGRRSYGWLWTHRLVNWVQMKLWW